MKSLPVGAEARSGQIVFTAMQEVVFGRSAAVAVPELADRAGACRVFLMVSATLNRSTELVARIGEALGVRKAGLYQGMPAHSPRRAVIEAVEQARAAGADLIVTVGGGSLTDAAKAVRLCLANDVREAEAMDRLLLPGCRPPVVGQVAVPTTLSAGEFSAISGVTDERSRTKQLLRHPGLVPTAVVLDPALTLHTPVDTFLSSGVRALDHCAEGICSPGANPYTDAQALQGLKLLAAGLPRVKADPADLDARLNCQFGAWLSMAPVASGVPMGASHGIGYVLGAAFGVAHGHTSCVMLPAVMRWNKAADTGRQALVAAALGCAGMEAADALNGLIAGLGMPRSLAAVGVRSESFSHIARQALETDWVRRNPRPIGGVAQLCEILEFAASG